MTTTLATRRFLADYARRPINVVLLVVVPVVFVLATSSALRDFARALGSSTGAGGIRAASAGWAAALIAGIGGFFHARSARAADHRLAAAAGPWPVVVARLASGAALAVLAAAGSLMALAIGGGPATDPAVAAATVAAALIYLGIGILLSAVITDEAGGSLLVVFVWILDVFLGPTMGTSGPVTLVMPDHFPTLLAVRAAAGTSGWAAAAGSTAWTAGTLAAAAATLAATTGLQRRPRAGRGRRLRTAVRMSFLEYSRTPLLWVLLVAAPATFIGISLTLTPARPTPLLIGSQLRTVSMLQLHGAVMVPITVGFLAGVTGLLVVIGSAQADRRLVLAGYLPGQVLLGRLAVIATGTLLASGAALAVTALGFTPRSWPLFATATVLVGLTYAAVGVLLGPLLGKLGALYLVLLLPFIDVGIGQDPMLGANLPGWGRFLPAHPASMLLLRAAFATGIDRAQLAEALAWLGALTVAAAAVFWRTFGITRSRTRHIIPGPPATADA